jgi:hypothetical protein
MVMLQFFLHCSFALSRFRADAGTDTRAARTSTHSVEGRFMAPVV